MAAAAAAAGAIEPTDSSADGERECWTTTGVREFSVPTGFVRPRSGDARSPAASASAIIFSVRCGYVGGGWTGSRADGGGWYFCPCPGCADGDCCAEFQRHGRTSVFFDGEHATPAAAAAAALAGEGEGGGWHMT